MKQNSDGPVSSGLVSVPEIDAFEGFVRTHQAGLRAFIRALGVEVDWVDDLAQEAFVIAFQKREQFEEGKDFGRWLRGIARNLVINERRKVARRARILDGALSDLLLEAEAADVAQRADDTALLAVMNDCVNRLPECSRTLLLRRYQTGENASVLAQLFQQSAEAIRQSLVRIRQTVKRCVDTKLGEAPR